METGAEAVTLTLENTGEMAITNFELNTGDDSAKFTVTEPEDGDYCNELVNDTLPAESSCVFNLALSDQAVVDEEYTFQTTGDDASNSPVSLTVTAAEAPFEAVIDLAQTGQTPTSPLDLTAVGITSADGNACLNGNGALVGCGVPWAYNGAAEQEEPLTPATRFELGEGAEADCIIDNLTGLMWPQDANDYNGGGTQTWTDALTAATDPNVIGDGNANNFTLCGHDDWRMPNIVELKSLLNLGQASQADWLNDPNAVLSDGSDAFANIADGRYWSSSTYAPDTDFAWLVSMDDGHVPADSKGSGYQVLPVRGPVGN